MICALAIYAAYDMLHIKSMFEIKPMIPMISKNIDIKTHIIIFNYSKRFFFFILFVETINAGLRVNTFHIIHDTTLIHVKTFKR